MTGDNQLSARLAIEALRAGVPNGAAIRRLGGPDEVIEARFEAGLDRVSGEPAPGFFVAGGFGSGKSHLLGYLREAALLRDFVVSVVAVSKETPVSVPGVTFAAAIRNAAIRGHNDDAVTLALARVQQTDGAARRLAQWAGSPAAKLAPIFGAILYLLDRSFDPDLRRGVEAFLSGAKPPLPKLRQALKDAGARAMFDLGPVQPAELTRQRMRFMPRLFQEAGFAGWVVLLDEVELIGRYGALQRALAYVELAQWLGLNSSLRLDGVACICAITDDYADKLINAKQDDEKLVERLRLRKVPRQAEMARAAMQAIQSAARLRMPDAAILRRHEASIRALYTEAYGWDAPPAELLPLEKLRTMRHHVRGWITQWDMLRVCGVSDGVIETLSNTDYSEDDRLTEAPEGADAQG